MQKQYTTDGNPIEKNLKTNDSNLNKCVFERVINKYDERVILLDNCELNIKFYRFNNNVTSITANNIVMILDSKLIQPMLISLYSYIMNSGRRLHVYLIAINCIQELIESISKFKPLEAQITIVEIYTSVYLHPALYKFFIPKILHEQDKCLYVDIDTICINKIDNLFQIDLGDSFAAVVLDYPAIYLFDFPSRISTQTYFNAGIILMNLAELREKLIPVKAIELKIKDVNNIYQYWDQDIFNILLDGKVIILNQRFNYLITNERLENGGCLDYNLQMNKEELAIIHYTYKKPWERKDLYLSEIWHSFYKYIFEINHPCSNFEFDFATKWWEFLEELFLTSYVRQNSALIVEANNCHGETLPGIITYLCNKGFPVDVVVSKENYDLQCLSGINLPEVRLFRYNGWHFDKILVEEKLNKYKLIVFNSRTLYYKTEKNNMSTIYEYIPSCNNFKHKILSLEHDYTHFNHSLPEDNIYILSNPTKQTSLEKYVVNLLFSGHYKIKYKKNKITKFIIIGNIDPKRKNFSLILEAIEKLKAEPFLITFVANRGELNFSEEYADKIKFFSHLTFEELYKKIDDSDFILPLHDPDNKTHLRYCAVQSSGTYNHAYAFRKPCIIHQYFAKPNFFDISNSLIYNDNNELASYIKMAIEMEDNEYASKVANMDKIAREIIRKSKLNLSNILSQMLPDFT